MKKDETIVGRNPVLIEEPVNMSIDGYENETHWFFSLGTIVFYMVSKDTKEIKIIFQNKSAMECWLKANNIKVNKVTIEVGDHETRFVYYDIFGMERRDMNKKYELVMDDTIEIDDATLYRIRALKDFGDVKAGDLGGYIEKESNLGHIGNCWIYDVARVCGDAKVRDNAKVYEHAQVCDRAYMFDNAIAFGNAIISGCAMVYSGAQVRDHAEVRDNSSVSGGAIISGDAVLYGDATIFHARMNHGATCQKMK